MLFWVTYMWNAGNIFTTEKRYRLLVFDEHPGQTTDIVKTAVQKEDTTIVMAPGTTRKVQPLDVVVNSGFKNVVDRLATEHMSSNMK